MIRELEKISKTIVFCDETIENFIINAWDHENLTKIVALSLYRDAVEGLDSLYILADHGSQNAAGVSYRHMFEVVLSLMYIMSDENKMKERAQSYYVSEQKFKINDIQKTLNNPNLSINEKQKLTATLQVVKNSLMQPFIQNTLKEWEKQKKKNSNYDPKWHMLFKGPKSVVQLVKYLNKNDDLLKKAEAIEGFPDFFKNAYSVFSRTTHSYSSLDNYLPVNTTTDALIPVSLRPLRIRTEDVLQGHFQIAGSITILLMATCVFLMRFYPDYLEKYVEFMKSLRDDPK